jgi:hypothetical protein
MRGDEEWDGEVHLEGEEKEKLTAATDRQRLGGLSAVLFVQSGR